MNRVLVFLAVLAIGFGTLMSEPGSTAQKKKREHYSATAMGTGGGIGGKTLPLDIYIDEYTTDEEAAELANVLKEGGQDALRRALEKLKKGRIAPSGSVGNDIAVIRTKPSGSGKQIILISARVMPWLELYVGGRSTNYNLSWLVLDLDEEGKGQGSVILGAKLQFTEDGKLDVESYGQQFVRLANIRRWD
jgi:hypothetical protein